MGMTPQHFHTIPTSCAFLLPLTQICSVCLLVVCRGLWKAVWWVVLGVHVDVHEDWVMLWVTAMYNVLAILSMADTVCLACMQKLCMGSISLVPRLSCGGGEREPGTHCSRMRQVPLVTCILLRCTKITVNSTYLLKGHTA